MFVIVGIDVVDRYVLRWVSIVGLYLFVFYEEGFYFKVVKGVYIYGFFVYWSKSFFFVFEGAL